MGTHVITDFTVEAIGTGAVELVLSLVEKIRYTGTIVLAGVSLASSKRYGAVFSTVKRIAVAEVISFTIGTVSVLTGIVKLTLVNILSAVVALEAGIAFAGVVSEMVYAGAFVTRITLALVDVYFAVLAERTFGTRALVSVIDNKQSISS